MTTTEILGIPQKPVYDCGNLQNDLHIGFGTDQSKRLSTLRRTDEPITLTRSSNSFTQPHGSVFTSRSFSRQPSRHSALRAARRKVKIVD